MQSTYNTHENVELHDSLSELVQVEKPLNDDTGHTLAANLLGYILKVAGLPLVINGNRAGTLANIHFKHQVGINIYTLIDQTFK